jgi:acyl carrier protein
MLFRNNIIKEFKKETWGKMNIKKKIIEFISNNYLKGRKLSRGYDTSFLDEGIIDSVAVIELVAFLEDAFNIAVEDEEITPDNLDSINKLETYVLTKIQRLES